MAQRKKRLQRRPRLSSAQRAEQNFHEGKITAAVNWARSTRDKHAGESGDDESIDDLWVAGQILAKAGATQEAADVFQQLQTLGIHDRQLSFILACCYAKLGEKESARATIDLTELNEESSLAFASSLADGGEPSEAVKVIEAARMQFPQSIAIEIELARLLSINQDFAAAKALLTNIAEREIQDTNLKSQAWFMLGELHSKNISELEAEEAYRNAIEADAGHYKPWVNLAVLLRDQGRNTEAISHLLDAAKRYPEHDKLNLLLALTLRLEDQFEQAIEVLRQIVNRSTYSSAWELLGRCLTEVGDVAAAIAHYKRWLSVQPKNAIAAHMLSALEGGETPSRASAGYIANVFDDFADTFEASLAKCGYCGPTAIGQILAENLQSSNESPPRVVLDAGCGTGLVGPILRGYASHLIGVDLSSEMLRKAKEKRVYDQLVCSDLETQLSENLEAYDLIVAADTFNYFGDLSELIPKCFAALKEAGWLVFSLEEGPLTGDHFYLQPHGRYVHSPQYIMEQLGECGIEGGSMNRVALRKEAGKDVFALLVAVQKPVSEPE